VRCGVVSGVRLEKNEETGWGFIECIGSIILCIIHKYYMVLGGPGSIIIIATGYGLDG
jgi:hypothetical protein